MPTPHQSRLQYLLPSISAVIFPSNVLSPANMHELWKWTETIIGNLETAGALIDARLDLKLYCGWRWSSRIVWSCFRSSNVKQRGVDAGRGDGQFQQRDQRRWCWTLRPNLHDSRSNKNVNT
ncbi:hypothetical protein Mapa_012323 [Marchantia paleacea]|nr:hypothetical protein Mapa_012323 [Marchantia paleacea]